ncbi:MAG: SIMPL domain-containing protein [Vulcanimicrobiaceae bacterium]
MRIIALLLATLMLGPSAAAAAGTLAPAKIAVTGTGRLSMMPDMATINADVTTNAPTSAGAVEQNNATYNRILQALSKLGVARDDVTLSYYNLNYNPKPQVMPPQPSYQRYGYTVSRTFAIKIRAMKAVGNAVDATTAAGATQINGVQFGLANDAPARAKALTEAVADARGKALALAAAANLHLIGIESIGVQQGGFAPMPVMRMNVMPAPTAAPTTFDPSSVNVTVSVSIVYLAAP